MTSFFGNSGVIASSAATNVAKNSLSFDGSNDYLSMTDANFGSFTRSKFAIAGAFYASDAVSGDGRIINQYRTSGSRSFEVRYTGRQLTFRGSEDGTFETGFFSSNLNLDNNTWYAFLVHYDSANGTSGDRIKMWINNSLQTASTYIAPAAAVFDSGINVFIGSDDGSSSNLAGLLYSPAFFDNYLPTPSEIFDGSSGALKNFGNITGLKSLLDGVTATSDFVLATDWTNNGGVTTSASKP